MTPRRLLATTLLCAALSAPALSQSPPLAMPNAPTTHILAIGHIVAGTERTQIIPVMQQEVRDTVRLYLAGKIEQWYVRRDQNGVVFLMNATSVEEARAMLDKLPLGKAKFMEFELIPVGPLSPLGLLVQPADAAPK